MVAVATSRWLSSVVNLHLSFQRPILGSEEDRVVLINETSIYIIKMNKISLSLKYENKNRNNNE